MQPDSTLIDKIPGEQLLSDNLQRGLKFTVGNKIIKQGKLILFKRAHYYLHITLQTPKSVAENFEIPIPFKVEYYPHQGLCYFDYRIKTLSRKDKKQEEILRNMYIKNTTPSQYYDKILEITVQDL